MTMTMSVEERELYHRALRHWQGSGYRTMAYASRVLDAQARGAADADKLDASFLLCYGAAYAQRAYAGARTLARALYRTPKRGVETLVFSGLGAKGRAALVAAPCDVTFVLAAPLATSTDARAAEGFADEDDDGTRWVLRIRVPASCRAADFMAEFPSDPFEGCLITEQEREILLPPGTRLSLTAESDVVERKAFDGYGEVIRTVYVDAEVIGQRLPEWVR